MARPDGPAYIELVPSTLVRAVCRVCHWEGPIRDTRSSSEAATVRRDVNVHNEECHDEWRPSGSPPLPSRAATLEGDA